MGGTLVQPFFATLLEITANKQSACHLTSTYAVMRAGRSSGAACMWRTHAEDSASPLHIGLRFLRNVHETQAARCLFPTRCECAARGSDRALLPTVVRLSASSVSQTCTLLSGKIHACCRTKCIRVRSVRRSVGLAHDSWTTMLGTLALSPDRAWLRSVDTKR